MVLKMFNIKMAPSLINRLTRQNLYIGRFYKTLDVDYKTLQIHKKVQNIPEKCWCIDENKMWQSAMERDLSNKS